MIDALEQHLNTPNRALSVDACLLSEVVTTDWDDTVPAPGQHPGPDGIKALVEGISESFLDFQIVSSDVIDDRATDGDSKAGARSEKDVVVAVHEPHENEIQAGRVPRTRHQEDWLGFSLQVGPAPQIGGEA